MNGEHMKKVIITGPTGSIGLALIKKCIKNNIEVTAVCRPGSGRISRIPQNSNVHVVECPLNQLEDLANQLEKGYDVFYHFGWDGTFGNSRNNMQGQLTNIQYTLDAVELADKLQCHTFIGAGSQAEYGRVEGTLSSETPVNPENGYGIAKLCAGQMSRILCQQKQMKHIWTRILSIYGPGDGEATMVMSTIGKLLRGDVPDFTKSEQMWDYLYSEDAAKALYLLGDKGKDGKIYCIGSGEAKPLKEYIETIRDTVNSEATLGIGNIPYAEKQVMYLCADVQDLIKDTGFSADYTFEEGIKRTVEWYKNNLLDK